MNVPLGNISCINQLTGAAHTGMTVSQRNSGSKYPMYDRQPRLALKASYSGDNHPNHGMKFILAQPDDTVLGKMHQQIVLNWLRGQHKPTLVAEGWTVAAVKKVCAQKSYTSEELLEYMQGMNCFAHTMTLTSYFDEIVYAYAPTVGINDVHETVVDKVARLCLENDIRPGVRTRQALMSPPYSKRWDVIMRPDGEFEVAVKKKADETSEGTAARTQGPTAVSYAEKLLRHLEDEEALQGERIAAGLPRPDPAGQRPVDRPGDTPDHDAPAAANALIPPWATPAALGTHTPMIDALRAGHVNEFRGFDTVGLDTRPLTFAQLQQMRNEMMQVPPLTDPLVDVAREIHDAEVRRLDETLIQAATQHRGVTADVHIHDELITTDPVQAAQDAAIFGTGVLLVPNVPTPPPPPEEPTTRFDPITT